MTISSSSSTPSCGWSVLSSWKFGECEGNIPRDLLFLSDLLLDSLVGVTPSILAAFSDISGGGDGIPLPPTTDVRRELVLPDALGRRSDADFDLDNGFGAPNMLVRPRDKGGLSAFSDEDPFEESFSSFSGDLFDDFERFKSESFDFLSSFTGGGDSS
jgi:hypothetical protein